MAKFNRRDFFKVGAATTATVALGPKIIGAMELKLGGGDYHPIRPFHPRKKKPYLCTMCPYLDGGLTYSENALIKKVEGSPNHIATRGKLCLKGMASFLGAYDPDRILTPLKREGQRGSGKWKEITWEEATSEVAGRIKDALASGRSEEVYLNEGSCKESPCVRFMNTLGSNSIIRSRFPSISRPSKAAALEYSLGVDFAVPDLANTRYVLNFGSNLMETAAPLAQRLTAGIIEKRLKLVTFDVRMSNTAGRSDEWIPVFPGSDGIIALAMANVIMQEGLADRRFIDSWTNYSSSKLAEYLKKFTPEGAAEASGVPAATINRIAVEFATTKPATIFTFNGVASHLGGVHGEMACLLLPVITGNIDNKGGLCLPRRFDIGMPQPAPGSQKKFQGVPNHTFPFMVKEGSRKVSVLLNHMSNPAYSAPASGLWREVLKDEGLVPYIVDFTPFMSETAELADIILPDVVSVERFDLASSPTALWPWASISVPGIEEQGGSDVRMTLQKIIQILDEDGSQGMKKYWSFSGPEDWVKKQAEATPELKENYNFLKALGVWPNYGKLDSGTRKILDDTGKPVEAEYGTYKKHGFNTPSKKIEIYVKGLEQKGQSPLPAWEENPRHKDLSPGQFVFTTFKVSYQTASLTTNLKYLTEIWHANPLWINREEAQKLGIADGELVRVTSDAGYLVTRAWLTNGLHPKVVGMSTSVGRWEYGRVAKAEPAGHGHGHEPEGHGYIDLDIDHNLWWRDKGVNPNDIITVSIDPSSGAQAWFDTVVTASAAQPGDRYGDVKADNEKHFAVYKGLLSKG